MWDGTGGRLWDRDGLEWENTGKELERIDAERLLAEPAVPAALSVGGRALRWLDGAERFATWIAEIAPNFHDVEDWKPPRGAPGQLPFRATVWTRDGQRLLLITDFD